MSSILLAEDDHNLRILITNALQDAHFTVDAVETAEKASLRIKVNEYDLAILDWCFAGERMNGIDLTRQICEGKKELPVLMLTGRGNLIDRVTGLQCGADDYLTKPFYLPELIARTQALLRRGKVAEKESSCIVAGPLELNRLTGRVLMNNKPLNVNNKEFQLLCYLLEKRGTPATRGELMEKVWGDYDAKVMSNTIDVHIRRLRKQLGALGRSIQTVRGIGYQFDPC